MYCIWKGGGGGGEGGRGDQENLFVCKIKFRTAIVRVVFVLIKSLFSISIPLRMISNFFCFVKVLNLGIVFDLVKECLMLKQVQETFKEIMGRRLFPVMAHTLRTFS